VGGEAQDGAVAGVGDVAGVGVRLRSLVVWWQERPLSDRVITGVIMDRDRVIMDLDLDPDGDGAPSNAVVPLAINRARSLAQGCCGLPNTRPCASAHKAHQASACKR
jgi:hypothetical protein